MDETTLLHQLFAAQARRTPEAVALVAGDRRLTYAELAARAGRLARRLGSRIPGGLRPETPVALCLPRDESLIVAMLAVLQAGGTYLPLDPGYPRERLAYLLDDSRAPLLVTCEALLSLLPPLTEGTAILLLDRAGEPIEAEAAADETRETSTADPDNLAYLIYTSGSTGRPKGVAIAHRSAVAMVRWALAAFPPEELACVLAATSVCFDLSVFEIFVPLAAGGTVVLAANALELPALPAAGSVTLVNTVPSAIAELVRRQGVPDSVRVINLAGEALPGALVASIYRETAARKVYNLYGPSEDTTYSTFALIARGAEGEPPIGRPLPGTEAYLLDELRQPVPEGEVGELFLSGAGLARGYLGRPDLTAERFLPDGRAAAPGARVYRTGDLARRAPDGELRFLGRIDSQVKVRGFRIELGEIEAALARHPAVREAAVLARPDRQAEGDAAGKVLVAYLALDPPRATAAELASFLGATLPGYMVPSAFVALESLPRNANGKLDRGALAAQADAAEAALPAEAEGEGSALRAAYVEPRTPVESRLAGLWFDLLSRGRKGSDPAWRIGSDDSFFHLGGHSLNGTLLLSRLRDAFGVDLQLADLFAAPTLGGLAALIEERAPRGRFTPSQPEPIPHGSRLPIGLMQSGLWFASRLDPGVPKFNIALAFALTGPLALAPLRAALAAVVRRHESLRTRFLESDGETVQEILPPDPALAPVPEVDLSALPRPLRDFELSRLRRAVARRPFELEEAPLFRLLAVRVDGEEHALFLTVHHIVFDGWSERVFWDDLSAYYAAALAGEPDPLPEPVLQFADFSLWQERWLTPERVAPQVAAWRANLAGLPPLALPTDRPRGSHFGWRGAVHHFQLSPALTQRVREAAREDGATPFMVLLAGFAAVTSRHSGQDDFAISAPVSGRRFSSVERAIGLFTGEVPLRVDLSTRPSMLALVTQLRHTLLAAFARQDLPFDALLRELGQTDLRHRARLFDVGFQVVGEAYPPPSFPGVEAKPLRTHTGTAKLELEVEIEDRGPRLGGRCEFPLHLFDPATVARLFEHYAVLLEAALGEPDRPIADLDLLAPLERTQLLAWSQPPLPPPEALLLHQLVALQGARSPGAVALDSAAGSLTYGELLARSAALARELRALGAGPESLVAVCAGRSPAQVAAFLAILETGAAYLPLDSGLPAERRDLLLADAAPAFLVAEEGLLPTFGLALRVAARPLGLGLAAIRLKPVAGAGGGGAGPENLAYVLYTSGSTGKPKAVCVPHRAVVNRLLRLREDFAITPADAMLHKAHAGFDVAVGEIFAPLVSGARLVLADPDLESDPDYLASLLAARRVTLADFVPTLLDALLPHPPFAAAIAGLRQLFVGAETLPISLRDRLTGRLGVPVANMYGPTEATIDATWGRFFPGGAGRGSGEGSEMTGGAPIGRPFAGCAAYVLAGPPDTRLQPVGVAGELYLGGLCLARGYLGRPDLTAEVFVPDPFSSLGGERLYRTGDRCRWRDDGQLEFLDRVDRQVKVRGVRIEPAEIEAALRAHPGVRDAAVAARRPDGAVRLLACVVPFLEGGVESLAIDLAELRTFLASRLPEAMVPADFVVLPALPLGANGKVDRRALAALEPAPLQRQARAGAPRARPGLERVIAAAFAEVLGKEGGEVSGEDDFFALGGHSLLATRAIWRLRQELAVRLTLRDFFAAPTPAALAARLRERLSLQPLVYWRQQLQDLPSPLDLPADGPGPNPPSFERTVRRLALASGLAAELRYLAQREAVSVPVLLLAAFEALLSRLGGRNDFLVAAGVSAAGSEVLLLRARLEGDASFLAHLASTRETVMAALAHRGIPLELLLAELGLAGPAPPGARRSPAQIGFAPLTENGGETAAPPPSPPSAEPGALASCDLILRLERREPGETGEEIGIELAAAAERFAGATVLALLDRFERLLAAAVASPVLPLSALPLLSPAERHQVLVEWRSTAEAGARAYVVDRDGELQAPGSPGGLLLGGPGRTGDFGGHPERVAASFVPDPFTAEEPGARLYRTGDLVRHRPSGEIEVLGRIDGPARVRGFAAGRPVEEPFVAPLDAARAAAGGEEPEVQEAPSLPALRAASVAERAALLPLSFPQQRLWFLDRLAPGGSAYNIPLSYRLLGPLVPAALAAALSEVVRRHAVLRTRYVEVEGEPRQEIASAVPLPLPHLDLTALPAGSRAAELERLAEEEQSRPFDLGLSPVLRALLVGAAAEEGFLLATVHHIAADGWSIALLLDELEALYPAALGSRRSPLAEPRHQYADFALWQRAWPPEAHSAQLAFWSGALAGAPTVLDLPSDRPRPARPSFGGVTRSLGLGSRLSAELHRLAQREGVTLYMLLLGVFEILVARAASREDFLVGSPLANRTRPELEELIGFFVNTLPLRARVPAGWGLRRLLRDVRDTALEAFAHQDLPFEELVDAFDPEREPSRNPLVQVLFALQTDGRVAGGQSGQIAARDLGSLLLEPVALGSGSSAKFDLTLFAEEGEEGIELMIEAASDLFEATTVLRYLEHYTALLASAVAAPSAALADLDWLTPAARHQALVEWGDTRTFPRHGPWVHERVAAQARRSPGRPAVIHGGRQLTYFELDRDATALAFRLRALGVGPESRVGVCLPRSPELVVSVLAVLKAGGAFVALDPAHPEERLRHQLEDAEVRVLLGQGETLSSLAAEMGIAWIDPGAIEDGGEPRPHLPPARLEAENLAYVIFTSGSTGRPKGVELTHGALLNLAIWQARALGAGAGDRTTVLAGVGFDASVLETWPYLSIGATLCIVPEEVRLSAEQLQLWLLAERIDLSFLPVPLTEELLGLPWPAEPTLRGLSTGGDRLRLQPPESLPFPLVNLYGPTEGTVISTYGTVPPGRGARAGERAPSIGRPIANAVAFVAGRELEPRPIGFPGELLIGGEGLARGYLRRPDLTAAGFIPDPLSGVPGARLYRTGDLVRLRADGNLEFLGRIDSQVKIRGYRIELGEIEATLARTPGVREAAVLLREGALVAFVAGDFAIPEPEAEAELEAALRRSLPDYMVPARFAFLPSLPATASDKIDRRALAALVLAPRLGEGAGARPALGAADPIADLIAGIWGEVLGVGAAAEGTAIGRQDNFFHLGGHSLLVTRVLSRLREALGVDLPVRALFEAPTVAGLARVVAEARREGEGGAALPPLTQAHREEDETAAPQRLPLSFPQQRLWFIDRLAPDSPTYNIGLAFALRGPVSWPALAGSLAEVARRHQVLRTRFVEVDGQPWQETLPPEAVACPLIDLTALPEALRSAEMERVAELEAGQPFDLARGPVLRAALVRLAEPGAAPAEDHALLLTVHHIASDGESNEILLRELAALYPAALAGRPSPLPEPPIQYSDYALWQRAWPPEVLDLQLAYWRRQLAGIATLEVATDAARPPVQSFRGEVEGIRVPAPLLAQLRALAAARGVTLFMTLLAAWQALFHRLTGQTDVAVGSPVANRNRPAIEELVGFFINLLALRTDFSGDPGFGALLSRVRRVALEAYDHADLPFERLVDLLSPGRDLSRQPLVQVMFQLERLGPPIRRFGELELAPLELAGAVAKFDLTLSLLDRGADLGGWIEYARDLFDRPTIARLGGQLVRLLAALAADPEAPLSRAPLLAPGERHQLLAEWNDTAAPAPPARQALLLHQPFEALADARAHALAAVCAGAGISYGELEARANRLAHLLLTNGLERGGAVGVWMDRSLDMLVAVLGILKAGGHYLPLEASWPAERVETILGNTEAVAVLAEERRLADLEEMRWRLPRVADLVCLDVAEERPPLEALDLGGVRDLFDFVAERATDRVTAGGFVSAFTGKAFSEAEVDEYRDRVLGLAAPWLRPGARVLEIGSGSGLLLWEMAARGAAVWGVDPSPLTQERNRLRRDELAAEGKELGRVELLTGFAHEVDDLLPEGERFDLVLLASTVQFFPGPRYLEDVLARAFARVAPGGALLVADVLDARRKLELRRAIEEQAGGAAASTAGGAGRELYLDEDQLRDLGSALPGAGEPEILYRETGFANELAYRYDVLLRRESEGQEPERGERRKRTWTAWHAAQADSSRPVAVASPDDLAYVIHTSGSTGEPKGIAVQHRPAVQLCDWINRTFEVGASDRGLFVASLGFDLSVYDVFGLLAAGGVVHVATSAELDDPDRLVALLRDGGITLWDSAPAALVRLAPLFPAMADRASRLRLVMLSGDWIPVTLPDRVRASFPGAKVMALGGATEATVWSNWFPVGEVDPAWPSIPYGRPISNARYHCLDSGYEPCPIGTPGDLYIGGDCLCVGYARRPDLTAAAFVPDPFSERPGDRLYRTGDRVRYRTDGNLEFLGRLDSQVKIRGYRIELGEIEIALARLPGIAEAVALAREDAPGDKRLVAYVVPKGECVAPRLLAAELRDLLRRNLPAYMVPAAFVVLEHLPVTANGKLDRKALPAPERESAAGGEGRVAPRNPVEERLALLWTEVLGTPEVSPHDNFFELGGHSLLATQLVARMRQTFGVDVPLHALFQRPTLADLAAEIAAATPEAAAAPVVPIARTGDLPLSSSQLRQWFLVQMEPGAPLYNLPLTLRLRGRLSRPTLARAFAEVARRQESFRTRFVATEGRPRVEIEERLEMELPVVDLAGIAAGAREAESHRLVQAQALHPFDLTRLPLVHLALLELAPEEHLLLFTVHHIVFDGWSLGVFTRELAELYEAFAAGRPSPLPELAIQYVDYAAWQQGWLRSDEALQQIAYWRGRLKGSTDLLTLPTDRPRPAVQTFVGAFEPIEWPAGLGAALRALARAEGTTLYMTLLAGFAALLQRTTRQADFNVGTWVANRRWREVEPILGLFVNTLVLRADLSGGPSFRRLLARIKETTVGAFEHQDLPFETLLDELGTERNLSHTPLFQTMFGLQNFSAPRLELPGLTLEPVDLYEGGRANFDLALWLWEEGEELTGSMQLNVDLFDRVTVRRWLRQLTGLFQAVAAEPGRRLAELPLLSAGERHQVVHEWADWEWVREGAPPRPALRPVSVLVAEQARRHPEKIAVEQEGAGSLTYAELETRSDALARRLRSLGAGPERVVGLCSVRCPEMVVALLAIQKSGGAYLPLDPSLPSERMAFLLEDAGAVALVTSRHLPNPLPALTVPLLTLDPEELAQDGKRDEARVEMFPEPDLEGLAYVLYTSGSTGKPKGVLIDHGALARFVLDAIESYGFRASDRLLQFASLAFDNSAEEIYGTLAAGGTLVLRTEECLSTPRRFLAACRDWGITLLDLPTAYWHVLAGEAALGTLELPPALRIVILGGERVQPELIRAWLAAFGPYPQVWNTYGPTEATVMSAGWPLGRPGSDPAGEAQSIPIGRPLPSTRAWLLDPELEPVPVGVAGELHLAGEILARGYLGRPELTAERFVPSPFCDAGRPGERLYRSGDLVRQLPSGAIDFVGRVDDQVKIRGFRIEPGEIASVLGRHPAVRDAAVVALSGAGSKEWRLVAYLVANENETPAPAELRDYLKAHLPAYMVPADYVTVRAFPLTATGKLDRAALPRPEEQAASEGQLAPPETETEEILAGFWRDLLGRERVGIYDDFFDLGGHSLLAPQLMSSIAQTFEVELPLRVLFEAPTVAQLAVALEAAILAQIEGLDDEEAGEWLEAG